MFSVTMEKPFHKPIDPSTKYCAVIGHPIRHSGSPAMHNAGFAELGLNWRYLAFDVQPRFVPDVVRVAGLLGFVGLNFTVPHKHIAYQSVDVLEPAVRKWEAVNTVVYEIEIEPGVWVPTSKIEERPDKSIRSHGYNTDADAIVRALREDLKIELAGSKIFIVGTGGAGRTAALRLAEEPISRLYLYNRTVAKAEEVAAQIRLMRPGLEVIVDYPEEEVDILINATSLGLKEEDPLPVDLKRFPLSRVRCVYDMIYNPPKTPLLNAAEYAGCKCANGLGMLLYQGAAAFELWTGRSAPLMVMRQALEDFVYGKRQ